MRRFLAPGLFGLVLLATGSQPVAGGGSVPPKEQPKEQPKLLLRANKASPLTQADVKRLEPQLRKGMTEAALFKALATFPVLTNNGELLWVLKDGILLTASSEGKEDSEIVCWLIRADR